MNQTCAMSPVFPFSVSQVTIAAMGRPSYLERPSQIIAPLGLLAMTDILSIHDRRARKVDCLGVV
jgi:hypothetical protein